MAITIDDRRDFVENITKLSLWLAWKYSREGMPVEKVINSKTPLYRLTILWDGENHPSSPEPGWTDERWNSLLKELLSIFRQNSDKETTDDLEREGLELLWPVLESRIEQDVNAWPWIPNCLGASPFETGRFGFFLYEFSSDETGEHQIDLHMGNSFAPNSPFDDLGARADELARLLRDACEREPGVKYMTSDSWLNSFKGFQKFFPPEWQESSLLSTLGYSYNWWGQFVNRRGGYHRRNGDYLRRTGQFPYPSVICKCTVESLGQHLKPYSI